MKIMKKKFKIPKLFKNKKFILSMILLLGFVVRLYKIDNPVADWHSWRQADTASVTREYLKNGFNLFLPRYHDVSSIQTGIYNPEGLRLVELPIYNLLHLMIVKSTPLNLEVSGRLLSIILAMFSTYFMYLIGKKIYNDRVGILSAFFFAFLPFNIYFTRVILPEPLAVFFGLLSMVLFVDFINMGKKRLLYMSAVLFSLGMLIKPFIVFYIVPLLYLVHKKYDLKKTFKNFKDFLPFLIAVNLALIPFFAWRIWINNNPIGVPRFLWAFNENRIRFKPSFWRWIFGERIGHLILGSWGVVVLVFSFLSDRVRKNKFIPFFLLGMFLYVATFATASVRHDYYQTLVIPSLSLALAVGADYMWREEIFGKKILKVILVFSVFIMFLTAESQTREFYKINHPEILAAGEAVDRLTPKDALIIASYSGDTAFLYQTKRRGWPVVDSSIEEIKEKGAGYFVSVNFSDPDLIEAREIYETMEVTSQYIILDLNKPL